MTKTRNWTQYNESLVNRENVALWFSNDLLKFWNHSCRRGRLFPYGDTAIETLTIVREVFHLAYRSAEGGRNMFFSPQCSGSARSSRRCGRQHRAEGLRRGRMEGLQTRKEQTSNLA